jgi:hypothetical protein
MKKKILLLDLDETLIHSVQLQKGAPITENFSYVMNIPLNDGTDNYEVKSLINFSEFWCQSSSLLPRIFEKNEQKIRTGHLHSFYAALLRPDCERPRC